MELYTAILKYIFNSILLIACYLSSQCQQLAGQYGAVIFFFFLTLSVSSVFLCSEHHNSSDYWSLWRQLLVSIIFWNFKMISHTFVQDLYHTLMQHLRGIHTVKIFYYLIYLLFITTFFKNFQYFYNSGTTMGTWVFCCSKLQKCARTFLFLDLYSYKME